MRDESDEERELPPANPNEPIREKGDKRLIILDEEFASGLACTKREGNTLYRATVAGIPVTTRRSPKTTL